ncbi:MAG TPA: hypothetical protein VII56_07615 [Rhizomicrobium sp.]
MKLSLFVDLFVGTIVALGLGWLITYLAPCFGKSGQPLVATTLAVLSGWAWCLSAYLSMRLQTRGSGTTWQFGSNITNWIAAFAALLTGLLTLFQNYHLQGLCR